MVSFLLYIDLELSLLAKNEDKFNEIGVTVIRSSYECCELALDKMKMFNWLEINGYNCAKSYLDKNEFYNDLDKGNISFPVFVKPYDGSASLLINKVDSKKQVNLLFEDHYGLMIQEFLNGQELVQMYILI